jgi:hypothetical protein
MNDKWNVLASEPHSNLDIKLIAVNLRNYTLDYTLRKWT